MCERTVIHFHYNARSGTIVYEDDYRTVNSEEDYEQLKHLVVYRKRERMLNGYGGFPWVRFPRSKDGVSIPLLLWYIFNGSHPKDLHYENKCDELKCIVFTK